MEAALDPPSRKCSRSLVFLERERDQLVSFPGIQLHLPPKKDPQQRGTADEGIIRHYFLLKKCAQLRRRVLQ